MINKLQHIFFLGIKGVAMANLAVILKKMGKEISGFDCQEEFITDSLLKKNKVKVLNDLNFLPSAVDLVVYSAAHQGRENPLVKEAVNRGIKTISQPQLINELMKDYRTKIAVCGCHGKTTTTSLLAYALLKLKKQPTYLAGVPYFNSLAGADYFINKKDYFVVEADEYGVSPPNDLTSKFLFLTPDWIIATNIDYDHPDVYRNLEEVKTAFYKFFHKADLILNLDDPLQAEFIRKYSGNKKIITYGFSSSADYQIVDWQTTDDGVFFNLKKIGQFKISLFGFHNVLNATAVIALLIELGNSPASVKKIIEKFSGAKRRMEVVYNNNNFTLVDDYAHHPREIEATIKGLRERYPKRRLILIFQPHTFSRTERLLIDFQKSLSLADITFVLPIFGSAREQENDYKISSKDIAKATDKIYYIESTQDLLNKVEQIIKPDDVIVTMGAGDVYRLAEEIKKRIEKRKKHFGKKNCFKTDLDIKKDVDLKPFNTLKMSAAAEYFFEAKTRDDLIKGKKLALKQNLPLLVIGGGSNIALLNDKINGLVIKNSYQKLEVIEEKDGYVLILVSSGYPVARLITLSIENGWSGLEYHHGLPGTVGGAIYMNSKWTRPLTYFSDNLLYAYLVDDNGKIKKANKEYFQFAYDFSILQKTKEIVLEAGFRLKKDSKERIKKRAADVLKYRKKTQPLGVFSCGCFFKNPGNISAGYLIDQAGLKGFSVGDYFVSPVHANFIINRGNGKKEDILQLLDIIKSKVKKKFNIDLEEEVIII